LAQRAEHIAFITSFWLIVECFKACFLLLTGVLRDLLSQEEEEVIMSTTQLLMVAIAIVVIAAIGWFVYQSLSRKRLESRFGPEYEKTLNAVGSRRGAERELKEREERVEALDIRPLDPAERSRYAEEWRRLQARFVDEPAPAIDGADRLIRDVMQRRGYPVGDFERRAQDLSVNHPIVVQHYRAADSLAASRREGKANTEDLRQALVHYRALFNELLEDGPRAARSENGPRWRARTDREVNVERAERS
jgi:hypothetical protein